MHLYKKALILTVLFAFIASTGVVAVSAQTSSSVTAAEGVNAAATDGVTAASSVTASIVNPPQLPISSSVSGASAATAHPYTATFNLLASSQSVKVGVKTQRVGGYLRNGATKLGNEAVELWYKAGSGSWTKLATGKTGTGTNLGYAGWYVYSNKAQTIQWEIAYVGVVNNGWISASNIVAVKYENAKTKPYQTYMFTYAAKPSVAHGTTATFYARLMNGLTGLGGKKVTVWKYTSSSRWVPLSTVKTLTGNNAGWVFLRYKSATASVVVLKVTFAGASPYAKSESNVVRLVST